MNGMKQKNAVQFVLCAAALVLAFVLAVVSILDYRRSAKENSSLTEQIRDTRSEKDTVIASNEILREEVRHLKNKIKDAKKDLKDIEKIPKRIQQIDKLSGNISDLEAQLADLDQEIEALRSQLPPGTVVETDD